MRRGTTSWRRKAVAAGASGGETRAPRAKAAAHGKPGTTVCAATPTTMVVKTTRPTASNPMGRRLARRSRHDAVRAAR